MSLKELGKLGEEIQVSLDSFSSDIEDMQEIVDDLVENTETSLKQSKQEILQLEQAVSSTEKEVKKEIKQHKDIVDKKLELQNEILEDMEEKVNSINSPEIDFSELEKKIGKKADKKHRHNVNEIDGLDNLVTKDDLKDFAMKSDIKEVSIGGGVKGIRGIVAGEGITIDDSNAKFPIISASEIPHLLLLGAQGFSVDTVVDSQVTEAHREDGTTVENTYNISNKLQTAVYTFPDTSTLTLTITYDIDGNVSTALYS